MSAYEELRDGATGEGGDAWREADRRTSKLHALYRELKEDPRYTTTAAPGGPPTAPEAAHRRRHFARSP